jgi:3-oxoacyl-[acyl-carrier protein] reductase
MSLPAVHNACNYFFRWNWVGFIATPMTNAVPGKILAEMTSKVALRRLGRAEDVANLVIFLASNERSRYITGEAFECSGMIRL